MMTQTLTQDDFEERTDKTAAQVSEYTVKILQGSYTIHLVDTSIDGFLHYGRETRKSVVKREDNVLGG